MTRVNVARRPEELEPARRAVAIGTFDGVHRGHRRVIEAAEAAHLRSTVVTFDPHPRTLLGGAGRAADDARAAAGAARGGGRRGRARAPLRRGAARARRRRRSRRRCCARSARRSSRPATASASAAAAAATSSCSSGSASTCAACRSSTTCRRATSGSCSPRATSSMRRELLGRPPEVEGIVVTGDQRGEGARLPDREPRGAAGACSCPQLGIYAGSALGHRAAISIGTNPHYGGTERRVEALPARLRRRPLRAAARGRALGAAAGRGRLRLRGGARRGDRERRGADARGRPPGLSDAGAASFGAARASIGYGGDCTIAGRSPCFESVRCLECGEVYAKPLAGGTVRRTRAARPCGYVGWIPLTPAAGARVAPLRRGSAAAPARPSALTPPK